MSIPIPYVFNTLDTSSLPDARDSSQDILGKAVPVFYLDSNFARISKVSHVGATPVSDPYAGCLWLVDSQSPPILKIYSGSSWIDPGIGPISIVSGNVGIGTATPEEKLEIDGNIKFASGSPHAIKFAEDQRLDIQVAGGITSDNPFWRGVHISGPAITVSGQPQYPRVAIYQESTSLTNPTDLRYVIKTGNVSGVNNSLHLETETGHIILKPAGNVGIGTTSPSYQLHLAKTETDRNRILIENTNTAQGGSRSTGIYLKGSGVEWGIYTDTGTNGGNNFGIRGSDWHIFINGSNGYVGIGTTNPDVRLDVAGNIQVTGANKIYFGDDGTGEYIYSQRSGYFPLVFSAGSQDRMVILNNGNVGIGTTSPTDRLHVVGGKIAITDAGSNTGIQIAGSWIGDHYDGILHIRSGGSVVSFDGDDRVGVGTIYPSARLHVQGDAQTSAIIATSGGSYYGDWPGGWGGGLATYDISLSGLYYNVLQQRSDVNLKTDITYLDETVVLEKLLQLKPVSYRWKNPSMPQELRYGFIAQDVEPIIPNVVGTDNEGKKSLDYIQFIPMLVKAIQEQQEQIEKLRLAIGK